MSRIVGCGATSRSAQQRRLARAESRQHALDAKRARRAAWCLGRALQPCTSLLHARATLAVLAWLASAP